ncbi:MAG: hydantoinase/oxoprolinase family protein [bacterium]|nr:hydantoinase/oxoprolinase family protein [bacterium]
MSEIRVGIDVGGTFTHAVALDAAGHNLLAQVRVPTTHRAAQGVAHGIVEALERLLQEGNIDPSGVRFIAHSTTQATNALLEGDVAPVGIIGMGAGMEGRRARGETSIGDIELSPGRWLKTYHRFIDTSGLPDGKTIEREISALLDEGARVIVACQAFGVDDPTAERLVLETASAMGVPATAGHEVSQLYGLRMRTRTSVINASMLPKMVETARMTERSVRDAGITAPLMVMRSDGGVMSIDEMMRRPILTILSGPAAGVAAALIYARVSYGIFVEVGGTSTDISVITDGRPQVKPAEIGGHRLYLETLDVRTVGLAGGSLIRLSGTKIADVGPRSAHIAGLPYASFSQPGTGCKLEMFAPFDGDPGDYVRVVADDGGTMALTPTCADRIAGGRGTEGLKDAWRPLAKRLGLEPDKAARAVLKAGCAKLAPVIEKMMAERRLDKKELVLVGGGGGAEAILPWLAEEMDMEYRLADNAPVISAIGVAIAMVRDVIERNVVNPGPEDLQRIRREAEAAAVKSGALPQTIEVRVEVDQQRQLVRAVATGTTEMRSDMDRTLDETGLRETAAVSLALPAGHLEQVGGNGGLTAFTGRREKSGLLGLFRKVTRPLCLIDGGGIVRLRRSDADVTVARVGELDETLAGILDRETRYGDAGASLPAIFIAAGGRLIDLSGLLTAEQVRVMADDETSGLDPSSEVMLITGKG